MELEEMVCSLEQAKKLHKLGVKIDTYFEYVQYGSDVIDGEREEYFPPDLMTSETRKACEAHILFYYSAPTVAELGVMLPTFIVEKDDPILEPFIDDKQYSFALKTENGFRHEFGDVWISEEFKTEAHARCAALIWLIENGYLKAEDIKL